MPAVTSSELKISVITVVLNGEKYLEQAINSVLSQSYRNFEYIVIDGLSTDGSAAIIRNYEQSLAKWVSEPDRGMYDAINKGISYCTGQLIGILNCDDWYEPGAFENIINACNQEPGANVYHGMLARTTPTGQLISVSGLPHGFLSQGMIDHPACFVSRKTYEEYGPFDTALKSAADYEFMLRISKKQAKFVFIKSILANFRSGGLSSSFAGSRETLLLRRRYGLISFSKMLLLLIYWRLKNLL